MLQKAQELTKSPILIKKDLKSDRVGKPWCRVAIWRGLKEVAFYLASQDASFSQNVLQEHKLRYPTSHNVMCFPSLQWLKSEASPGHINQGSSRKFLLSCLACITPFHQVTTVQSIPPAQAGLPCEIYHLLGSVPLFVDICIWPPELWLWCS